MVTEEILKKLSNFDVKNVTINGNGVKLQIQLPQGQNVIEQESVIKSILSNYEVNVVFILKDETTKPFKKIIAISSGKGGVGKSTVAINIAFALKEMGYKVGILDADIYAPSIPAFLNVSENPTSNDGRLIEPILTPQGFQLLSMGLFLQGNQSPMWRGPMLASAFNQFLEQGNWQVDYLIIDLPPGTSDIHMSCTKISQQAEFFLVSTPSKIAYTDVYRMYAVLRALNLKVVGLIENMAYSLCSACGHKEAVHTNSQIKEVEKIIELPIFNHFHELGENGYPADYKLQQEAQFFHRIAENIVNKP